MMDAMFPSAEEEQPIQFHFEDVSFDWPDENLVIQWIQKVITEEKSRLIAVSIIFCSDTFLHEMNVQYLDHDTLTDIITFPYLDPPDVEGDIFISTDRVRENAQTYGVAFEEELHRVIIHGILHLCGYLDKTPADKERMTQRENSCLDLLRNMAGA